MGRILLSGLTHIETTARVELLSPESVLTAGPALGVETSIAGAGYLAARALASLGDEVRLLSFIGGDPLGHVISAALSASGVSTRFLLPTLSQTVQSLVLHDGAGHRQESLDLKELREVEVPELTFQQACRGCSICVLCGQEISAKLLPSAERSGLPIAVGLDGTITPDEEETTHLIDSSDILFARQAGLPCSPERWVRWVRDRYGPEVVIVELSTEGALLWVRSDNFIERFAALSSEGPGRRRDREQLFSAFLHGYVASGDPYDALEKALFLASRDRSDPAESALGSTSGSAA